MDMKKKLEGAYTPDKQTRREKVLIGLSGGIDSYVTAYLLKIQKYDLFAATVVNSWDTWEGSSANVLSCHIDQAKLDEIRDFCQRLSIPHYVIKSGQEFKEEVAEDWVAHRLAGKLPRPCWNCHEMRMKLLHQKMKETGATFLATGHFAKLFQPDGGSIFIHTSNDEEHDQSALLSRVPHSILKNLLLPLSDLTRKEVVKLAENFGVKEVNKIINIHECFPWKPEMKAIFEKTIPPRFLKGGEVTSEDGHSYPAHEGVFEHSYGEPYEHREVGKTVKHFMGGYTPLDKVIHVMDEGYFVRTKIHLTSCHYSEGTSWPEPVRGILVMGQKNLECWIHPKSLNSAFIELAEPASFKEGDVVSVTKKKGRNAKVYLTGKVRFLPVEPIIDEGEPSVPQVDRSRDY